MNKDKDIVEEGLWDHYSELPNPLWYEWKEKQGNGTTTMAETNPKGGRGS